MKETAVVDNRVFLLGLDQLYREAMKQQERGELLRCARTVAQHAKASPANVPIEGYYGEHPALAEYFRLVRALQAHPADSALDSLAELRRLREICGSRIFGTAVDTGMLLPMGRDSLSEALQEVSEWTVPSLVEAACRRARETDDISLVGLAARARDEVALAAVRESTVLYLLLMGISVPPPDPKYLWQVDEEIENTGRRFVDTFNGLFGPILPMPSADAAETYWSAYEDNDLIGRCVRIGTDPTKMPAQHYHWTIRCGLPREFEVRDFWSEEVMTTDRHRNVANDPALKPRGPKPVGWLSKLLKRG